MMKGIATLIWEGRLTYWLLFLVCCHGQIMKNLHFYQMFTLAAWLSRCLEFFRKAKRACSLSHSLLDGGTSVMILGWKTISIGQTPAWLIFLSWLLSQWIISHFNYDVIRYSFLRVQAKCMLGWYLQDLMCHCELPAKEILNLIHLVLMIFRRNNMLLVDRHIDICR